MSKCLPPKKEGRKIHEGRGEANDKMTKSKQLEGDIGLFAIANSSFADGGNKDAREFKTSSTSEAASIL